MPQSNWFDDPDAPSVRCHQTGRVVYRASAIGGCTRSLWAARTDHERKPYPEKFQKIFKLGHEIESLTKQILYKHDFKFYSDQQEVRLDLGTMFGHNVNVIGHIDGIMCNEDSDGNFINTSLIEIKGLGPDLFAKYKRTGLQGFKTYAYQISAYCYGMETDSFRYIIYQKNSDLPVDDFGRLVITTFDSPPIPLQEIYTKIYNIEKAAASGVMPSCNTNYPCQYFYLHDEPQSGELTAPQVTLAKAYKKLDDQVKEYKASMDKIKEKLVSSLDFTSSEKFKSPLGDITITMVNNASRIDTAKVYEIMKSAGVEESEYMKPGVGSYAKITTKEISKLPKSDKQLPQQGELL